MKTTPACALPCLLAILAGCAAPSVRRPIEDQTRRVAPLPTCVLRLEPRGPHSEGTVRPLREAETLRLLFPSFDEKTQRLSNDAESCIDTQPFRDPLLAKAAPAQGSWPWHEQAGDILYGAGGDRLRVVWLRAVHFSNGTVGGPLAVVRGSEQFAEAFGLGVYRGHPYSTLGTARMGPSLLVTAEDDGCTARAPRASCDTTLTLYAPRMGSLVPVAQFATERVAFAPRAERGASDTLQYRLTASVDYRPDGIRVLERVAVQDASGTVLRKAERERSFLRNAQGTLTPTGPSLWEDRVPAEGHALALGMAVRR